MERVVSQQSLHKQCTRAERINVPGEDAIEAHHQAQEQVQQLPWPTKRQCGGRPHCGDNVDGDCGSAAIRAIKGYCRDRNMPSVMYRPVADRCGDGNKFRLTDLIDELHRVFAEDRVNIEYVQYLMESYRSDPAEWLKYAKFNKFRYTRNLVDAGNGKFNLMVLCWGEGNGSSIHNHPQSDCLMKILAGQLTEVRFAWPEKSADGENDDDQLQPMHETGRTLLETESVCHINGQLII